MNDIIFDGDLFLFEGTWHSSRLIRWWTSGSWFALAPYSHVGIAVHASIAGHAPKLCVMDATKSGTDPIPLSRYVEYYGKAGGKVFVAPLLDEGMRPGVLVRANEAWGSPYPPFRQWLLTAFRGVTGGIDGYPGYASCQELVAHCYNLQTPTRWFPWEILEADTDDLARSAAPRLFGTPRLVSLPQSTSA